MCRYHYHLPLNCSHYHFDVTVSFIKAACAIRTVEWHLITSSAENVEQYYHTLRLILYSSKVFRVYCPYLE